MSDIKQQLLNGSRRNMKQFQLEIEEHVVKPLISGQVLLFKFKVYDQNHAHDGPDAPNIRTSRTDYMSRNDMPMECIATASHFHMEERQGATAVIGQEIYGNGVINFFENTI